MRLTIRLLGTEVFHVSTDPEPEDDKERDLSGGTLASTPMGFVARFDRPDELELPDER